MDILVCMSGVLFRLPQKGPVLQLRKLRLKEIK